MIEREEKDGVCDEKKAFGVFIFYVKKKKTNMRTTKKSSKKKSMC